MEKKYGYMIIHNSYLLIIPLSVECTQYEKKKKISTQPTESKCISMSEQAKEITALYTQSRTLSNRKCLHTVTTQEGRPTFNNL